MKSTSTPDLVRQKKSSIKFAIACQSGENQNIIITGPTGAGKTFIACALANKACRDGYRSFYIRSPKFSYQMSLARGDGSYGKIINKLSRANALVIDDLGLAPMTEQESRDRLEVIGERYGHASTVIVS